jgi:hypothetical protein
MSDQQQDQQDLFGNTYVELARRGLVPKDLKDAANAELVKRGVVPGYTGFSFKTLDDAVRSIARGATFGWADEIAAAMNTATSGGSYEENLAKEKARTEDVSAAVRIPGEIGGAVLGTVAAAPARGAAMAATGLSKVPALARAVVGGATGGALYGSEEAGPGNRVSGAVEGAGVGAVGGAAVHGAVRTVQHVFSPVNRAIADIERAFTQGDITLGEAQQRAQAISADRPGVTLADVGGEGIQGLMERVAQTPGAGRTIVKPFLEKRQAEQADRIASDLSQLTGAKQSAFNAINETMQQRATQGKPLYDAAMNFNARADEDIVKAWDEATSTGWGKAILNSSTLRRNIQSQYGIEKIEDAPLMTVIDSWKKAADDLVGKNIRAGEKNVARTISETRDDVLDVVKQKNPAYAQALSAWAGKSQYLDAIEEGKTILGKNLSADELRADFAKLGDSEKEGYRIGAVSAVISKMRSDPANLPDLTKYLKSPEVRDKIAAIMPSKAAADAWKRRLDFEVKSSELVKQSLGNSSTARRQAAQDDAKALVGDMALHFVTGGTGGFWSVLKRQTLGRMQDTIRSRTDKEIAKRLTARLTRPTPVAP